LGRPSIVSTTTSVLLITLPNTVNPPFCLSRLAELFPMLKKNSLVALLGSPFNFAIAIVPRLLERVALNSFLIGGWIAMCSGAATVVTLYPPPCTMKSFTARWK
jgi:hypothetical protein